MAADLELRTPTLLVGTETGGHPNGYGDARKIVLPESGVTVRVSSLYWQLTGPLDRRDAITPLVPIEERYDAWRARQDPALEAALAGPPANGTFAGAWKGHAGWGADRLDIGLTLERRGTAWSGHIDIPDADLHSAPLPEVHVTGGELAATWRAAGEPWTLHAKLAGTLLVGLVRYKGVDYAYAARRWAG
jgi:hypothetical protein